MKSIFVSAIALAMVFPAAAYAQSSGSNTASQPRSTAAKWSSDQRTNMTAIDKLKTDLQNAGFTDVQVVADSFVVQAKDKSGNPVVMTLSPGGVTAYEAITTGGNNIGTTGSGNSGDTGSSSTAKPN